jgi:Ni/Co efflux regulator RcnB
MKKTILTILGTALIAASVGHAVSAAEHHTGRKAHHAAAPANTQFRNSNAYFAPSAQPDSSRYQNGAESAPAGR